MSSASGDPAAKPTGASGVPVFEKSKYTSKNENPHLNIPEHVYFQPQYWHWNIQTKYPARCTLEFKSMQDAINSLNSYIEMGIIDTIDNQADVEAESVAESLANYTKHIDTSGIPTLTCKHTSASGGPAAKPTRASGVPVVGKTKYMSKNENPHLNIPEHVYFQPQYWHWNIQTKYPVRCTLEFKSMQDAINSLNSYIEIGIIDTIDNQADVEAESVAESLANYTKPIDTSGTPTLNCKPTSTSGDHAVSTGTSSGATQTVHRTIDIPTDNMSENKRKHCDDETTELIERKQKKIRDEITASGVPRCREDFTSKKKNLDLNIPKNVYHKNNCWRWKLLKYGESIQCKVRFSSMQEAIVSLNKYKDKGIIDITKPIDTSGTPTLTCKPTSTSGDHAVSTGTSSGATQTVHRTIDTPTDNMSENKRKHCDDETAELIERKQKKNRDEITASGVPRCREDVTYKKKKLDLNIPENMDYQDNYWRCKLREYYKKICMPCGHWCCGKRNCLICDPLGYWSIKLRCVLRNALIRNIGVKNSFSGVKKSGASLTYFGVKSFQVLKAFIQSKMDTHNATASPSNQMEWNKIDIDHIRPIAEFRRRGIIADNELLNHYTNLQPLSPEDNNFKRDKWTSEDEVFWRENIIKQDDFRVIYNPYTRDSVQTNRATTSSGASASNTNK